MQATDTSMYTCIYARCSHEQFRHAHVLILVHKPDYVLVGHAQRLRLFTWIDSVRLPLSPFDYNFTYSFDYIKLPEPLSEPLNEPPDPSELPSE